MNTFDPTFMQSIEELHTLIHHLNMHRPPPASSSLFRLAKLAVVDNEKPDTIEKWATQLAKDTIFCDD